MVYLTNLLNILASNEVDSALRTISSCEK